MTITLKPLKPEDAIRSLEARGRTLSPSFAWQDIYGAEHSAMFTVARSAGFDVLQDIFNGLSKALSDGRTPAQFARELTPLLQAKGWWGRQIVEDPVTSEKSVAQLGSLRRLETIFNANMRVSYAAGHWASFERNKATRPYLRYVAIMDERTRPEHAARHNLCLPVDHPYWNLWAPPCGWNCRCTLQSLSQRQVDQMRGQLKFEPPIDVMKPWVNKRTGEVREIPQGIDPGWDHNPGRTNAEAAINDALAQKAAGAPYELMAPLVEERLRSDAFKRFMKDPQGTMPVLPISDDIAAALKTETRIGLLSAATMRKQLRNHPELTAADYAMLPTMARSASLALTEGSNTIIFMRNNEGRWLYVVLKTTASRSAAYLTSFRFIGADRIAAVLARPGVSVLIDRRGD